MKRTIGVLLLLGAVGLLTSQLVQSFCTSAIPGLTDALTHAPPTVGTFAYDTFTPGTVPPFPDVGGYYVDPVFNTAVTRLSNIYPASPANTGSGLTYGKNGLWTADGSGFFVQVSGVGVNIINTITGATLRTNTPYPATTTDEVSFAPDDPNTYYYTNGTALTARNWSTQTSTTAHTFPATLSTLGQSGDWIDKTGNLFLVNYSGALHIWNKSLNLVYTGSITMPTNTCGNCPGVPGPNPGWAGISPDGNWVTVNGADQATGFRQHLSYAVDNTAHTLSSTGNMFWDDCFSDHGNVLTATDGNTYMIVPSCNSDKGYYRAWVNNNFTPGAGAGQLTGTNNVRLLSLSAFIPSGQTGNGHHSCPRLGVRQDWCYSTIEDYTDLIGGSGAFYPYRQEVMLIHMLSPFEVYRLAHHRARGSTTAGPPYCGSARVSSNWDGSAVIFGSNMSNLGSTSQSCGYGDSYRITTNF